MSTYQDPRRRFGQKMIIFSFRYILSAFNSSCLLFYENLIYWMIANLLFVFLSFYFDLFPFFGGITRDVEINHIFLLFEIIISELCLSTSCGVSQAFSWAEISVTKLHRRFAIYHSFLHKSGSFCLNSRELRFRWHGWPSVWLLSQTDLQSQERNIELEGTWLFTHRDNLADQSQNRFILTIASTDK